MADPTFTSGILNLRPLAALPRDILSLLALSESHRARWSLLPSNEEVTKNRFVLG
jgi:hypothetical protein